MTEFRDSQYEHTGQHKLVSVSVWEKPYIGHEDQDNAVIDLVASASKWLSLNE